MPSQQMKNIKWSDASRKCGIVVSCNVLPDFHCIPLSFSLLINTVQYAWFLKHFDDCWNAQHCPDTPSSNVSTGVYLYWSRFLVFEGSLWWWAKCTSHRSPGSVIQDLAQVTPSSGVTAWRNCSLKVSTESTLMPCLCVITWMEIPLKPSSPRHCMGLQTLRAVHRADWL